MPSFPHLLCAALCVVCGWSILHRSGPSYDETEITFSDLASKYDLIHDVVVAIKQDNIEYIEYRLTQISDPSNEFYGQYMTKEEVGMITANKRATDAVTAYLRRIGVQIISRSIHGEYITGRASIESWEKILNTTFYELSRKSDKRKFFRAREYQISAEIGHFVSEIFNTVQIPPENILGNMHIKHHRGGSSMSRVTTITPALLNAYYHIDSNMGNENASQSLFESLNQYYSDSDVTKFQDQYEISRSQVSHSYGMHESGVLCQFVPYQCAEANLDVQYLMAISQNTPTTIWYQPLTGDDVFLGWILAVASNPNPPLVHSISYGALERSMPLSYADAFNVEAIKLALQGVTIVASSGDDGVANFKARSAASECGYNPTWPASSAYVLSVGASQGPEYGGEEIACGSESGGDITTGGGFSTIFQSTSYQQEAVSGYFNSLNLAEVPKEGFDPLGRGYPDIAIAGHNYEVVIGGQTYLASGTSASAPVITGMISLVNSARLSEGKPPVGFINTALYQIGTSVANDIIFGKNSCTASLICCEEGFTATKGWDPLTGFGSLDFKKFKKAFLAF